MQGCRLGLLLFTSCDVYTRFLSELLRGHSRSSERRQQSLRTRVSKFCMHNAWCRLSVGAQAVGGVTRSLCCAVLWYGVVWCGVLLLCFGHMHLALGTRTCRNGFSCLFLSSSCQTFCILVPAGAATPPFSGSCPRCSHAPLSHSRHPAASCCISCACLGHCSSHRRASRCCCLMLKAMHLR